MTGIIVERGDQTTDEFKPVRVRIEEGANSAEPARGAYGTAWSAANKGEWSATVISLEHPCENDPGSITYARNTAMENFTRAIESAALITTVAGEFVPVAIVDTQASPITNGYAVTVRVAARRQYATDQAEPLRFMSGDLWELR